MGIYSFFVFAGEHPLAATVMTCCTMGAVAWTIQQTYFFIFALVDYFSSK